MRIRPEQTSDIAAIHALTARAFDGHPHSDGSEPAIIDRLRAAGALSLSLVAEQEGRLVGHVAFSLVSWCDQADWYGLGPVSVSPDVQKQGIGQALIRQGLEQLQARGEAGCVVLGPPDYYAMFGFQVDERLTYPGLPADYFRALIWQQPAPGLSGPVAYHPAFG